MLPRPARRDVRDLNFGSCIRQMRKYCVHQLEERVPHLDDFAEGGKHGHAAGVAAADAAVRIPQAQLQHGWVNGAAELAVGDGAFDGYPLRRTWELMSQPASDLATDLAAPSAMNSRHQHFVCRVQSSEVE